MEDYIDLTSEETNLEDYSINVDGYNCVLCDNSGKQYKGFLLAKSDKGNAFTICNVDFQWSKTDRKHPPRIVLRRTDANLKDKVVRKDQDFATVSFESGTDGYREFWQMIAFLSKFKDVIDLGEGFDAYQVVTKAGVISSLKEREPEERMREIAEYVEESGLSEENMSELLMMKARNDDVETFRKLLENENNYRTEYREQYDSEIKGAGDEAIWHHFLKTRQWIFGLSLNLRYIEDILDEASVGIANTSNQGSPEVDMLGLNDFTVLVELKTPETDIFTVTKSSEARTNTWSFSTAFIEGFSQCLAQKSAWDKSSDSKPIVKDGNVIDRGVIRTIDPQAIFIVGNKEREIPRDSPSLDIITKRETLERFIRNNRNVNIISYDELYRRAYQIAHGEVLQEVEITPDDSVDVYDLSDIPF